MKHALLLTAMLAMAPAAPAPALAQEEESELSRGAEMLREGLGLMLEGMLNEMRPAAEGWARGWAELVNLLGDYSAYELPEILPNGDILIRRKHPPSPDDSLAGDAPMGETDL